MTSTSRHCCGWQCFTTCRSRATAAPRTTLFLRLSSRTPESSVRSDRTRASSLPDHDRASDLSPAAIDVQLYSGNEGSVRGREERDCPRDFLRLTKSLHRDFLFQSFSELVDHLFRKPCPPDDGSDDRPWRHSVDSDPAADELRGGRAGERSQRRFGRGINARGCVAPHIGDAGVENNRSTIFEERQRFLD